MGLKGVKGGRAGPPRYGIQIPNVNRDDSRILALADFLRNEKRSGLHTKEAVQYEKVRDLRCLCSRPCYVLAAHSRHHCTLHRVAWSEARHQLQH